MSSFLRQYLSALASWHTCHLGLKQMPQSLVDARSKLSAHALDKAFNLL